MRNIVITIATCILVASAGNTQGGLGKIFRSIERGLSHSSSGPSESALKSLSKKSGSVLESGAKNAFSEADVIGESAATSLTKKTKMRRTSFESNLSLSKKEKYGDVKEKIKDEVEGFFEDNFEDLVELIKDGIDSDDPASGAPFAVRQPTGSLLIYAGSFSIEAQASGQRLKYSRCSSCGAFRYGPYRYGDQKKCGHSWF